MDTIHTPTIFLDIDGVLNTERYLNLLDSMHTGEGKAKFRADDGHHYFDPHAVLNLQKITMATNAEIVLSSTWRMFFTLEEFQTFWKDRGYHGNIVSFTKILRDSPRGWEIRKWINENRGWATDFTNYVIFDDDSDMMLEQVDNFIHITGDDGITDEHANRAIEILEV